MKNTSECHEDIDNVRGSILVGMMLEYGESVETVTATQGFEAQRVSGVQSASGTDTDASKRKEEVCVV